MSSNHSLAKAILDLRRRLNLSQTQLANKLGVSAMAVSRWERGENEPGQHLIGLAKLTRTPQQFWFFIEKMGLTKRDLVKR